MRCRQPGDAPRPGDPSRGRRRGRLLSGLLRAAVILAALVLMMFVGLWGALRASLPVLEGAVPLVGLSATVRVERDDAGVPTVRGESANDVAMGLGFLHAQDRFFQMDLLRRKSAGELAALLGKPALGSDQDTRPHRFRARAEMALSRLPPEHRHRLVAYAQGVNAGLGRLHTRPWEYLVLGQKPIVWRPEDSLLVIYTMWLDLQDEQGRFERTFNAVRSAWGEAGLASLMPPGDGTDAPLDGSMPTSPPLPPPLPRTVGASLADTTISDPVLGSNAFAVSGRWTESGAAMLASDMHLGHAVPNVWYRVALHFPTPAGEVRVVGVSLPGSPSISSGSNGRVAWGFTNAYIDTVDVVPLEVRQEDEAWQYRVPEGWEEFEEHHETLAIRGAAPETLHVRWTRWGPVFGQLDEDPVAVRWTAHEVSALNLEMLDMLEAGNVAEAVAVAHRAGMPNQNLLIADREGSIAWTIVGKVPERNPGFDGLRTGGWAAGQAQWVGWLDTRRVPRVVNPEEGLLWSANHRHVGGEELRRLGDNGYDHGLRAGLIRDRLRQLQRRPEKITATEFLAVQLEDHARHLEPWRELLSTTLTTSGQALAPDALELVRAWNGRADPASAGYPLVRAFRDAVTAAVMAPYWSKPRELYRRINTNKAHTEELVLRLLRERPADRLNPRFETWDDLLDTCLAGVLETEADTNVPLREREWGRTNRLEMRHPLSRALPRFAANWIDLPAAPLAGDAELPRNQSSRHGVSNRLVVSPGHEERGLFHMPGGQSGHPLSRFYSAGHADWLAGTPTPLLPGAARHTLLLLPAH
jgi:penicillin G amidase